MGYMKKLIYVIIIISFGCRSSVKEQVNTTIKVITVNTASIENSNLDISNLFEDSIKIVKLETKDECLLMANGKKKFTDDNIFIADKTSQKIFMFDWNGKYIKAIGEPGRGAGEYVRLGDFCVIQDSVYVQDAQSDKIIVYPLDCGKAREIYINPPIYYDALCAIGKDLYFVTNYSNDYNLIRVNLNNGARKNFLPYAKEINQKNQGWGLKKYIGQYKDTALLIFLRNDTVYNLDNDLVNPVYVVNYTQNKIPSDVLDKNGSEILRTALTKNYNTGLDYVYNMRDYIMGAFAVGSTCYELLYEKNNGNTLVCESFILDDYGKLNLLNYEMTDRDEFVIMYDALLFKQIWQYRLSKNNFKSPKEKENFKKVAESLRDDDNPVVFKLILKN